MKKRYEIDHEAVRVEQFKLSVRTWLAVCLMSAGAGIYTVVARGGDGTKLAVFHGALSLAAACRLIWRLHRFRRGL